MIWQKNELCGLAADIAVQEGIPPELCLSIADVLSAWNPAFVEQSLDPQQYNPNLMRQKSPNSRLGLLQISHEAAQQLGYKESQTELLAPALNIQIGCKLLKKALEQTGGNIDRSLLVCYGYSIAGLILKIQSKCEPYRQFLAARPMVTLGSQ